MNKKLVMIEWIDSKGVTSNWEHIEDLTSLEPDHIVSVGILFEEKEKYKTIIQSISTGEDSQILGRMTIPTCSIIKTIELKRR